MSDNKENQIDWKELRKLFFAECVEQQKVALAPHDLFEWFKKQIN